MLLEELRKISQPEGNIADQLRELGTERRSLEAERRLGTSVSRMGEELENRLTAKMREFMSNSELEERLMDKVVSFMSKLNIEDKVMSKMEDIITRRFDGLVSRMKDQVRGEVNREVDTKINEAVSEIKNQVKDGEDGKDGSTPSDKKLLSLIKKVMPKQEVKVDNIKGLNENLITSQAV